MYTFGPQEGKGYVATLISTPILISTSLFGGGGAPRDGGGYVATLPTCGPRRWQELGNHF